MRTHRATNIDNLFSFKYDIVLSKLAAQYFRFSCFCLIFPKHINDQETSHQHVTYYTLSVTYKANFTPCIIYEHMSSPQWFHVINTSYYISHSCLFSTLYFNSLNHSTFFSFTGQVELNYTQVKKKKEKKSDIL